MTLSPIRLAALQRQQKAKQDEMDATRTLPMLHPVLKRYGIKREWYPAMYQTSPSLAENPQAQIQEVITHYRRNHHYQPPSAISVNPMVLLRYLQQIAPHLFEIKTATSGITLEIGEELPEDAMICYRQPRRVQKP